MILQINKLMMLLEKQEQFKLKIHRWEEIIKIRAEINEIETKKNDTMKQNWILQKITENPLQN
jgi:hypothetical protein